MLSWVVKVVPQFPEPPGKLGEEKPNVPPPAPAPAPAPAPVKKTVSIKETKKPEAPKPSKPKQEEQQGKEENSSQSGMLTWISHGLAHALPQSPVLARRNSENELSISSKPEEQKGVIGWIVQELVKVVPQPDGKYKQDGDDDEIPDVSNVPEAKAQPAVKDLPKDVPDAEPLPHIAVVEIVSEEEESHEDSKSSSSSKVIEWIKQGIEKVVPQPEIHVPPPPKVAVAPPPPPEPPKEEDPKEGNVVSRIVQGLGRMLPQPVPRNGASDGGAVVQNRVKR